MVRLFREGRAIVKKYSVKMGSAVAVPVAAIKMVETALVELLCQLPWALLAVDSSSPAEKESSIDEYGCGGKVHVSV
jgi:hypothetical protein